MFTCLIELVKPYIQEIDINEVAEQLRVAVSDILEVEFWAFTLWSRVQERGAVFVSPRKLSSWLPAIKEALACCQNFDGLEKLKNALEMEFKTKAAIYSDTLQGELWQLVEQRWQQFEVETADLRQAEDLTQSYEFITKKCNEQESLNAVAQLIRKNYPIFELFPDLLQHLRQVWHHRRAELLSFQPV